MKDRTTKKGASTKEVLQQSFASRILIRLAIAIFAIAGMHLLVQYLNMDVYHQQNGQVFELSNRFDMDDESSLPTWFSEILFLTIAVSAFFASWLSRNAVRKVWIVVGAVGLLAAIDEIATLHEFVLQSVHVIFFKNAPPAGLNNAWAIMAPSILLAFAFLAWRAWQALPRRTTIILITAGVIFLLGALGIDMLTDMVNEQTFLYQGALVALEESMELFGGAVVLYGIIDYLEQQHKTKIKKAISSLRTG